MSYYLADDNGYLADFASIGGLADLRKWAAGQAQDVKSFFETGETTNPSMLATALKTVKIPGPIVADAVGLLRKFAPGAAGTLVISDGITDGEDEEPRAAAEIKGFKFNVTNRKAVTWAKEHAADLVSGVSKTTREGIRDLVESAFVEQFDVQDLADQIEELVGDNSRAELIARTEVMRASNEGQQELWDQAVEAGFLSGREQQEWIVTPDDRLCPVCEPLDGQTVPVDGQFDVDGDKIDGPPAHPNCRCTVGLVL